MIKQKNTADQTSDQKLMTILGMIILVLVFWDFKFFLPFKIFTVYLHELSHGLAAELTGGELWRITLSIRQGGKCYTSGGIREIVLSAGYVGSMVCGCLIFYGAYRAKEPQTVLSGTFLMTSSIEQFQVQMHTNSAR